MKQKKKSDVAVLLDYAGNHKGLTFLGLALSAVSMLLSMAPYICIWLAARELIKISVLNNCVDDPRELAQMVAERTHAQVVQVIGKKIVLYREGKDEKKKIVLP